MYDHSVGWNELGVAVAPRRETEVEIKRREKREAEKLAAAESDRRFARQQIKHELAEADEINERIAALDRRVDAKADEHSQVVAPLQTELRELGESNLSRRIELRSRIEAANKILESDLGTLHSERHKLSLALAKKATPHELIEVSTLTARVAVKAASNQSQRARQICEGLRTRLAQCSGEFHRLVCEAELSAALSYLAAAERATSEAMAAAIAE